MKILLIILISLIIFPAYSAYPLTAVINTNNIQINMYNSEAKTLFEKLQLSYKNNRELDGIIREEKEKNKNGDRITRYITHTGTVACSKGKALNRFHFKYDYYHCHIFSGHTFTVN